MMPQPLVVDVKEAAKTLGVSVWVMRHYIASGLSPHPIPKHEAPWRIDSACPYRRGGPEQIR